MKVLTTYFLELKSRSKAEVFEIPVNCDFFKFIRLFNITQHTGREELEINPTEQKIIILKQEKALTKSEALRNVVDSLKIKLRSKNNTKMVEIIEPERTQGSPSPVIEAKSLEPIVQKTETQGILVNGQTE